MADKLKMVEKNGKKVPFYAADGVGKMKYGGKVEKKAMGGKVGYMGGGKVKYMGGGKVNGCNTSVQMSGMKEAGEY